MATGGLTGARGPQRPLPPIDAARWPGAPSAAGSRVPRSGERAPWEGSARMASATSYRMPH